MSKINIRKIKEIAQLKINSASGSTSLTDLEKLMKLAMLSGGGHLSADSSGVLPDNGRVVYEEAANRLFINQRAPEYSGTNWQPLQPTEFDPVSLVHQGVSYGYSHGGIGPSPTGIEKYSFTSDGNATAVGAIHPNNPYGVYGANPGMSETHGYNFGGRDNGSAGGPYNYLSDIIKFPYAVDEAATDTGVNLSAGNNAFGVSNAVGNRDEMFYSQSYPTTSTLYKTPAVNDTTQTTTGSLLPTATVASMLNAGGTSDTHGYHAGGTPSSNVIQKFPFAITSGETATDVGDLLLARQYLGGACSTTHGYVFGGSPLTNQIQKYPFSSDANATDVGDMIAPLYSPNGTSSTTHAYMHGGQNPGGQQNYIQKVPFTTDENSTDIGDLTTIRREGGGSQV